MEATRLQDMGREKLWGQVGVCTYESPAEAQGPVWGWDRGEEGPAAAWDPGYSVAFFPGQQGPCKRGPVWSVAAERVELSPQGPDWSLLPCHTAAVPRPTSSESVLRSSAWTS